MALEKARKQSRGDNHYSSSISAARQLHEDYLLDLMSHNCVMGKQSHLNRLKETIISY